ncbi:hypothetical protein AAG570_012247 [Ranatra chinensis]|uniref:Pyruvate dehydrogenase phosphatase regulatory subunit, mitochondrial n=1 Tax=Ranatra chinensis TaxID=642074 RepID=A0ABD0Z6L3_9HEMI
MLHGVLRRYKLKNVFGSLSQCSRPLSDDGDANVWTDLEPVPREARVVVCGGGLVGASVAYHLAEMGWAKETILIEQGKLDCGPTWQSSGLVGVFKPSYSQVRLCKTSVNLLKKLEEQGRPTGWKQCGSLLLARSVNRMTMFRRMKAQSVSWDIECELVTPIEAKDLCPLIAIEDIKGGLWIPGDGVADPDKVCQSLIQSSTEKGVRVFEECRVNRVFSHDGKVKGIETSRGKVECDIFVNCAGLWARQLGRLSEPPVKIPLHPVEHYYLHTRPIGGLDPMTPVIRDQDGHIYIREYEGGIIAGGFAPVAKLAYEDGLLPSSQADRQLPEDWDHFNVLLQQILHRVPSLSDCVLQELNNVPEAFSADCKWIIGEAPEIEKYYVAAGMKTVGISATGGVGQTIADLIVNGSTSYDIHEIDINRFLGLHNNTKFLRERVIEVPGLHYDLIYPFQEFKTGRNLRMSPIYPKLREAGAVFGQVMGYERPAWFQPTGVKYFTDYYDGGAPYQIANTGTYGKPPWFSYVDLEYSACRETVGLSDYSSFTKIDMWSKGDEVVKALQYICSNDVDVPVGSILHTGMQNVNGGYENDCSLVRLAPNYYMMIAPSIQQTRCKVWIQKHLPKDGTVSVSDVTSMYTAICIMGPFTRTLLSELTDTDLSPKSFPFFTCQVMDVGCANGIRAMNLAHTGELGYVLYIPNEFALHVYNKLLEAGEKYALRHCGYYAMRALRVEKFYAFWGQDLDTTTTPLECGRTWRVKFDKGEFIGRDALLRQREEGVKRMYIQLLLNEHDPDRNIWSWGGEPIYRNGNYAGVVTTTSYGFTFRQLVCLGFIQNLDSKGVAQRVTSDFVLSGDYEVDICGTRYPAKVHLHSPNLPTKYPDQERDAYHATRNKMASEPILEIHEPISETVAIR